MGKDAVNFIIKTPEWTMNVSMNPNEGGDNSGEERAKRLMAILKKFPSLSPEIQEKILDFLDTLEKKIEKTNGDSSKK
jgi:hypothetical protein